MRDMRDMRDVREVLWELEKLGVTDKQIRDFCEIKDRDTISRWWGGSEPSNKNRFKLNRLLDESIQNASKIAEELSRKKIPSQRIVFNAWENGWKNHFRDIIRYLNTDNGKELMNAFDNFKRLDEKKMLYIGWKCDSWVWDEHDFLIEIVVKYAKYADTRRRFTT